MNDIDSKILRSLVTCDPKFIASLAAGATAASQLFGVFLWIRFVFVFCECNGKPDSMSTSYCMLFVVCKIISVRIISRWFFDALFLKNCKKIIHDVVTRWIQPNFGNEIKKKIYGSVKFCVFLLFKRIGGGYYLLIVWNHLEKCRLRPT